MSKYLCREDYLNEGVRIYKRVLRGELPQTTFGAWIEQAKPSQAELANVSRRATTRVSIA